MALAADTVNGPAFGCSTPRVSCWRVDPAGVPAEWVESTVATEGQLTLVYFVKGGYGVEALQRNRPSARDIAVVTGARVLTVACSQRGKPSDIAAVNRGLNAYAWLLSEGCDVDQTAFTHDANGAALAESILVVARNQGLPVPAGGIWPCRPRSRSLGRGVQRGA